MTTPKSYHSEFTEMFNNAKIVILNHTYIITFFKPIKNKQNFSYLYDKLQLNSLSERPIMAENFLPFNFPLEFVVLMLFVSCLKIRMLELCSLWISYVSKRSKKQKQPNKALIHPHYNFSLTPTHLYQLLLVKITFCFWIESYRYCVMLFHSRYFHTSWSFQA